MIKVNIFYFVITIFLLSCKNNNDKVIKEKVQKKLKIQIEIDQNKKMVQESILKNNSDNNINKSSYIEAENTNQNEALETARIDQYIKGKISINELMSEAFIIAKNRYLNSGDGNFRVLCQEIKSQYPSRIEELNFFYMQNQNNLTSKQKNDLSSLIQSMKNLFDNAFRS
jgi:hypothetical protein